MRIERVRLDGVRGLPTATYEFLDSSGEPDLVVITGRPGGGKSTLLEAIIAAKETLAPSGAVDFRWTALVPFGQKAAKVTLVFRPDDAERASTAWEGTTLEAEAILGESIVPAAALSPRALQLLARQGAFKGFAYFHPERELTPPRESPEDVSREQWLTRRNAKFSVVYPMLESRSPEMNCATDFLRQIFPNLAFDGLIRVNGTQQPRLLDHAADRVIPYELLSTGERAVALVALTVAATDLSDSIVLFDSPEVGLGDAAPRFLAAMIDWAPRSQWIVATSSEAVAQLASNGRRVHLS
jgi:energy-coupling factor transporter ATP-binding protein EcfA2